MTLRDPHVREAMAVVAAALALSSCSPSGEIVRVCHGDGGQIVRKHGRLYARVSVNEAMDTLIASDAKLDESCRP